MAKRLEELPLMAAALPAGKLCWSVGRELSRVATAETEAQWIGAVARCTAHQVERKVARHQRGAPARSALLAQVLVALVGMGWKQRDAQAMVDRAKPHVGPETSAGEAMRLALREGALPNASWVREELATYSATHVGRGAGWAAQRTPGHAPLVLRSQSKLPDLARGERLRAARGLSAGQLACS